MPTYRLPVDLTWSNGSGSPGANVFHVRTGGLVGTDDEGLEEMSEALRLFYSDLNNLFPDGTNITFAGEVTGVGSAQGESTQVPGWTVAGIGGASVLPPATQIVVNWKTGSGGRSGRGRTFLGPLATGCAEANGTPVEAVRSDVAAAAATLIGTSLSDINGALGVYSRQENVFRDWQSATTPNQFAVLRSRRD